MSEALRGARRIIVKVGSSLVTNEGRGVDPQAVGAWCRQMAELVRQKRELVMVSSGAIAEGMKRSAVVPAARRHELRQRPPSDQMGPGADLRVGLAGAWLGSAQVLLTHARPRGREAI